MATRDKIHAIAALTFWGIFVLVMINMAAVCGVHWATGEIVPGWMAWPLIVLTPIMTVAMVVSSVCSLVRAVAV